MYHPNHQASPRIQIHILYYGRPQNVRLAQLRNKFSKHKLELWDVTAVADPTATQDPQQVVLT